MLSKEVLIFTLEKNNYDVPKTAKELNIARTEVYYHLKKYSLKIIKKKYLTTVKK